jgi:hypothetical protein
MEKEILWSVIVRSRKNKDDITVIGDNMNERKAMRVLSGVRINLNHKDYIAEMNLTK